MKYFQDILHSFFKLYIAFFRIIGYNRSMFNFAYEDIDFAHKLDTVLPADETIHNFTEILYLVSGNVKFTVEDSTRQLSEGDLVLIHPGQYHFAQVNTSVPYERYVLKFPEHYIPETLKEDHFFKENFFSDFKQVSWLFSQFDTYTTYPPAKTKLLFICDMLKILTILSEKQSANVHRASTLISSIISFIHERLYEPLTLDTLANHFNFSKSYISTEFKKEMNIPVMQYIRAKKIILAHQLITNGEKCVDVAEKLGFENYSTFYRSYLNVMGFPPAIEKRKNIIPTDKI